MNKKKVIIAVVCVLVLWVTIGIIDYNRVNSSDKPLFCVTSELADDGGSGRYVGLGYSFNLDGHLENSGKYEVDAYVYKVFGINIKTVLRPEADIQN